MIVRITHRGHVEHVPDGSDWNAHVAAMVRRYGAWEAGVSRVDRIETTDAPTGWATADTGTPQRSTWERQTVDETGKARAERLQDAVGVSRETAKAEQYFETGTTLAQSGVDHARQLETAHKAQLFVRDEAARFVERIEAEQRTDRIADGASIAKDLTMNGALRWQGYKLRTMAVRGLLARAKSPAWTYVAGLRDRIASNPKSAQADKDRAQLLTTMQLELDAAPRVRFMLRTRDGLGDVFAAPSPEYGRADAPSVLPQVIAQLPDDARGTVSYNPASTRWELRAGVWTPTPADELVVGEPFEAFVSVSSADGGNGGLDFGGGTSMPRCLNFTVYVVESGTGHRRHRSRILIGLSRAIADATNGIHTLVRAWGEARADVLEAPDLVPLEAVIPGFFRHMLTSRKGELVGVLRGRTETHVQALAQLYPSERRDTDRIVRSDLAQTVTKYVQTSPGDVRHDAETAVGSWLVKHEPVAFAKA